MANQELTIEQQAAQLDDLPLASDERVRRELWLLLKKHRWAFSGVCGSYLAMGGFTAFLPRLIGLMTDRAAAGVLFTEYQCLLLWSLAAAAASGLAAAAARVFSGWLGAAVAADARCRFIHQANSVPLGLVERLGAGQLIARVTDDVNRVAATCKWSMLMLANSGVLLIATTAQVLFGTGWLGLAAVPMLIIWASASQHYLRNSTLAYQRIARSDARVASVVTETTRAAETVDALNLGRMRVRLLGDALRSMWVAQRFAVTLRANYVPQLTGSVLLTGALVVIGAAWLIPRGNVSMNHATTALASVALMFPFARMFGMVVDEVQLGHVSYARLLGLEKLRKHQPGPRQPDTHQPRTSERIPEPGPITLDNVDFSYRPGVPVLQNVTLTIQPGETTALVGPSGCGKSTVARLIAGMSTANSGVVSLAGIDVSTIPSDQLRRGVVQLTQEQHVFAMSVADNLRLAAPEASDSNLESCLAAVGARWWLESLPDGMNTAIGDGGVRIGPDRVVMMSSGRVTEVRPHTELLAAGRGYATLFNAWNSSQTAT